MKYNKSVIIFKKYNKTEVFIFIITLMAILFSKTVFFGIVHSSSFQYIFFFLSIVGLLICVSKKKTIENKIIMVLPFLILFAINFILYMDVMNATQRNQLIGMAITFMVSAIIMSYVNFNDFSYYYIKIMVAISLISIPCCLIANFAQDIAYSLCQPGYDWQTSFGYSVFYTWGINGTISLRNAGPFWEAGAFQGFLFIALIMLVFNSENGRIKRKPLCLFILVFTILTTQSTTGYLLLLFLLLTQWKRISLIFNELNKILKILFMLIILVGSILVIYSSNNVSTKLSGDANESAEIRSNDVVGGFLITQESGLFGLGETNLKETTKSKYKINKDDSTGLTAMSYTYGILFFAYYILLLSTNIKNIFNTKKRSEKIFIFICLIVLQLTESVWFFPIYLFMLFGDKKKKEIL